MDSDALARRLRGRLDPDLMRLLRTLSEPVEEAAYDAVFDRVVEGLKVEEERIALARERIDLHYRRFMELPEGRRLVVLTNSSPAMLVTLARDLMARSFEARFHDLPESLCLAQLACEVTRRVGETGYLSPENLADLRVEAWGFLGNAERINSNMEAAEAALQAAARALDEGTGDRDLKADFLSLQASLKSSQGLAVEAARLVDREVALRRLLGDQEKLGGALVDRGWMACWAEGPTVEACRFVRDGLELATDRRIFLIGLLVLAEAFARDDQGLEALLLLSDAKLVIGLLEPGRFEIRYRWIRGITYRVLGEFERAEELLVPVRAEFVANELTTPAAVVTMDLVSIYAQQKRFREARILAAEAHDLLVAQGLENKALAASLLLQKALVAETEVSRMAVAVANFLARHGYNRNVRLDWEEG